MTPSSFDSFTRVVAVELDIDLPEPVDPDATLDDLGFDSLHRLELVDLVDGLAGRPSEEPPTWRSLGDAHRSITFRS